MLSAIRHETWTGGEHYWIASKDGQSVVRREGYEENETVYAGHYEDCVAWIEARRAENVEHDLGI